MADYKNILKVETLDDGTMNVFMKSGKRALIEIARFNEKFEAAIYHLFIGDPVGSEKRTPLDILGDLSKHSGYKDCAKEAIGWVDDNLERFTKAEEIGSAEYK